MTQRLCRSCRGWHKLDAWPRECAGHFQSHAKQKGSFPVPYFRRDHMDALFHPLDGQTYDSRSDYDAVTKSRPDVVEMGNDTQTVKPFVDDTVKDDVLQAMSMVSQGYKPSVADAGLSGEGWVE